MMEFKKSDYILPPNQIEKHIYFIVSGCTASFIDSEKESICVGFFTQGDFFCEYISFIDKVKSRTYSKALKDTTIAAVHYQVLNKAYKISIDHQARGREIAERLYKESHERTLNLMSMSAEERYLNFLNDRKEDLNEVPLKIIASYLGNSSPW